MSTKTYLYKTGDKCTSITGGWYASDRLDQSVHASQSGKVSFNENSMDAEIAYGNGQAGGKIITKNKINVTNYSYIYFHCKHYKETDPNDDLTAILGLFKSNEAGSKITAASIEITKAFSEEKTYKIDISNVEGEYYIGVRMGWRNDSASAEIRFLNIYLESYDLNTDLDSGSSVTVYRSYSRVDNKGRVTAGKGVLSAGDIIKITFSPKTNYKLLTHTVNGKNFVSGNSITVSGDVSIKATSEPLASDIGATDAKIGSSSAITITRYNSSYTHTVSYTFGSKKGTIVEKSGNTSISWKIPDSFYSEIPNSKSGTCVLTCDTYNGSTKIGSSTCNMKITVNYEVCMPTVSGTVEDINPDTINLTGDSSVIVRFKSTVKCVITATGKNGATIVSKTINGVEPDSSGVVEFSGTIPTSYVFSTTDSRGYVVEKTISPTVIPYIKLTMNPVLKRPLATTGEVVLSFDGNYYNGSFGLYDNTLSVRYRYKESSETSYGSWTTIPSTQYVLGQKTYKTTSPILLSQQFDYKKSYDFQVQAYDGVNGGYLIRATSTITVRKGETVFDWGENDFAFHVPVSVGNKQIKDLANPTANGDAVPNKYMQDYVTNYVADYVPDYVTDYVADYVPGYVSTHNFEPVLLWENAKKTSTFGDGSDSVKVSLNLSSYGWVIIEYRLSIDNAGCRTKVVPVGPEGYYALEVVSPSNNIVGYRAVTVRSTTVSFQDATYNAATNNNYIIPTKIYGLRGKST